MNPREFLAKGKPHLIIGGLFVLVLAFNITMAFTAGQTLLGATWTAISEIKLMDYLMLALFWYACAHRPKDDWDSSLITLNLSGSNTHK
ncbi:MAG: hypothetical protein AABN95_25125 [Acidobacteriota bacterium]